VHKKQKSGVLPLMKNGELRQFFLSAKAGTHPSVADIAGKIFLVVSARQSEADFLMDGILYQRWNIYFLNSNSEVIK